MRALFKKLASLKLAAAFLFLCFGLFAYSQALAAGCCKSCGDFNSCGNGNPYLQYGWEDCDLDIVGGRWICTVSGSYCQCSGSGNGGPPGQVE